MKKLVLGLVIAVVFLEACTGTQSSGNNSSQQKAEQKAQSHQAYSPTHDLEFKNYNRRQRIADDPTTILWCTSAFPIPSSPLFTVPVVGKLTSGSKRPYPTERAYVSGDNEGGGAYTPEIPGPDGMYGPSDSYRYGFTPQGIYAEWAGLPTYCSTQPTVWQRQETTIALAQDPTLLHAQQQAKDLIRQGKGAEAEKVLEDAVTKVQGGK